MYHSMSIGFREQHGVRAFFFFLLRVGSGDQTQVFKLVLLTVSSLGPHLIILNNIFLHICVVKLSCFSNGIDIINRRTVRLIEQKS